MLTPFCRILLLGLCSLSLASAQQGRGTMSGTVTDASGAAVPGARVVITNAGTNATFPTATNEVGFYTAPAMPVGAYTVSVEKDGFKKSVRSGITLQVDQRAELNFQLEIVATVESVEVIAEAPLVDTGSATVGKVVENRRINDLPLNGRNVLALMLLTPGVKSQAGPTNSGFADRGIALETDGYFIGVARRSGASRNARRRRFAIAGPEFADRILVRGGAHAGACRLIDGHLRQDLAFAVRPGHHAHGSEYLSAPP